MKKLLALLLALVLGLCFVACGEQGDNPGNTDNPGTSQGSENNDGWPTSGLGANIPEPDWEYEITRDDELAFVAKWADMTPDELRPYIAELEAAGFNQVAELGEGSTWYWQGKNSDKVLMVQLEDGKILVELREE